MRVTCGVIVTDGARLLLGHATGSPRWDIPKGLAEPDERFERAAARELLEETGLHAPDTLISLGRHTYLRDKDLVLFAWRIAQLPDPQTLICASLIDKPGRQPVPELDRFGLFSLDAALSMVGRNLARVLNDVWPLVTALPAQG